MHTHNTVAAGPQTTSTPVRLVLGFLLLAIPYHAAEYAMRFHGHIFLFLGFMLTVIAAAYAVARWQGFRGLGAWGLQVTPRTLTWLAMGLGVGGFFYVAALLVRLWLGIEVMAATPGPSTLLSMTLLFALGTFLPSLAEDILTRGYLYRHLRSKTTGPGFILLSSTVYVLNHVYALGNGPAQLLFLFVLGLVLAVPLVNTRNLWYTVGVHWAGNIVYRVGNDVLAVRQGSNSFPGLWVLTFFLLLLLWANHWVTKRLPHPSG